MRRLLYLFLLIPLVFACTEKETINEITNEDRIFEDNIPPPFDGVTTVQIQNYVNKVYIDLIGREPTSDELDNQTENLKNGNLEEDARITFVESIMADENYNERLWEIYKNSYTGGINDDYITYQLFLLSEAYNSALYNGDTLTADYYMFEIGRFQNLGNLEDEYATGQIDISEAMTRLAYNLVYDEINMGSENFVLACFENFLKRSPTEIELVAGVTMVDGVPAQLLLSDGTSKSDFLEIVTHSPEFYQGLVIDIYQILLTRLPESEEMGAGTTFLQTEGTYKDLQLQVMVSSEYAGF